ncbi:uncharacterized protein LOC115885941 isoform X2 [Sitophilus oryzae]|uniref:Uncharacterized protein LOC115885941 isoform X2 n=1 Tax=Sitophilus oryzae TaxID=7048 RepID=A0A6J2YD72_SITOR|nr:uncharacterized protein LOC115885941 isoform X2 [Sitophilus oryzae]
MFTLKYLFFFAAFLGCFYVCTADDAEQAAAIFTVVKSDGEVKDLLGTVNTRATTILTKLQDFFGTHSGVVSNMITDANTFKEEIITAIQHFYSSAPPLIARVLAVPVHMVIKLLKLSLFVATAIGYAALKFPKLVFGIPLNLIRQIHKYIF